MLVCTSLPKLAERKLFYCVSRNQDGAQVFVGIANHDVRVEAKPTQCRKFTIRELAAGAARLVVGKIFGHEFAEELYILIPWWRPR